MLISKLVHLFNQTSSMGWININPVKLFQEVHVIFDTGKLLMITDLYIRSPCVRLLIRVKNSLFIK
jgi:hypothetical protein